MSKALKAYREFETFNMNWDSYSIEEKRILNADFKTKFFELGNKPLEI